METKFTGGTWVISGGNQIVSMPSQCKIANGVSGWTPEEAEANAKLIAAAPEMFEALANAVRFIKCCPELSNEERRPKGLEKWESILQKATE